MKDYRTWWRKAGLGIVHILGNDAGGVYQIKERKCKSEELCLRCDFIHDYAAEQLWAEREKLA